MVCTLKEFNEYRQYLTTLKLKAEKMYMREEVGKPPPKFVGTGQRHGAEGWGFPCSILGRGGRQCRRGEACAAGTGSVAGKGVPGCEQS